MCVFLASVIACVCLSVVQRQIIQYGEMLPFEVKQHLLNSRN